MSDVVFTGPDGQPLPDDSSVGDAAWHGGFDMTLDGKLVSTRLTVIYAFPGPPCYSKRELHPVL